MTRDPLGRLAALVRDDDGLVAALVCDDGAGATAAGNGSGAARLGALAASGSRARGHEADYELLVEAIREGFQLHYGRGRVLCPTDPDLALLAGDRLYALGLERLAGLGDIEGIVELADVIALAAQAQAGADAEPRKRSGRRARRRSVGDPARSTSRPRRWRATALQRRPGHCARLPAASSAATAAERRRRAQHPCDAVTDVAAAVIYATRLDPFQCPIDAKTAPRSTRRSATSQAPSRARRSRAGG